MNSRGHHNLKSAARQLCGELMLGKKQEKNGQLTPQAQVLGVQERPAWTQLSPCVMCLEWTTCGRWLAMPRLQWSRTVWTCRCYALPCKALRSILCSLLSWDCIDAIASGIYTVASIHVLYSGSTLLFALMGLH